MAASRLVSSVQKTGASRQADLIRSGQKRRVHGRPDATDYRSHQVGDQREQHFARPLPHGGPRKQAIQPFGGQHVLHRGANHDGHRTLLHKQIEYFGQHHLATSLPEKLEQGKTFYFINETVVTQTVTIE